MPKELRVSIKLLSKIRYWRKPVKPTLHLSKAALETPLPAGFLHDIRDFLTRRGHWKGHTIDSIETFIAMPALGVSTRDPLPAVIGLDEPVFTSVGFGMREVKDGVAEYTRGICEIQDSDARCGTYLCITQAGKRVAPKRHATESIDIETCYWTYCKANSCGINSCSSQSCGTQSCIMHDCSNHACSEQNAIAFTSELDTNWNHPFVQELGRYFKIDMRDDLAAAVLHYVGRNMFDETAR
jgi:hypothetical protein